VLVRFDHAGSLKFTARLCAGGFRTYAHSCGLWARHSVWDNCASHPV